MHKLDHVVIAANNLDEGTSYVENKLNIKLSDIGYHKDMGTHNRVVKISKSVYLEVISIDPNCGHLNSKRWFNLDSLKLQSQLRKSPRVIGYVIENVDKKILKYYEKSLSGVLKLRMPPFIRMPLLVIPRSGTRYTIFLGKNDLFKNAPLVIPGSGTRGGILNIDAGVKGYLQ